MYMMPDQAVGSLITFIYDFFHIHRLSLTDGPVIILDLHQLIYPILSTSVSPTVNILPVPNHPDFNQTTFQF